jgi:hypothetical protein
VLPGLPGETASAVVPLTVPSLSTASKSLDVFYGPSFAQITNQLTRLEVVQAVPAHSAMLLFGTGLAGLIVISQTQECQRLG